MHLPRRDLIFCTFLHLSRLAKLQKNNDSIKEAKDLWLFVNKINRFYSIKPNYYLKPYEKNKNYQDRNGADKVTQARDNNIKVF